MLLAIAGHFLLWRWAGQQLAQGMANWVAAQRSQGWTIKSDPGEAGGWPLAATLLLPATSVNGGNSIVPGGLTWRAERVQLRIAFRHPSVLEIIPQGPQSLSIAGAPPVAFGAEAMRAVLPLSEDASGGALDLSVTGFKADAPEVANGASVAALTLRATAGSGAAPGLLISLEAEGIGLPASIDQPFGSTIAHLGLDAAIDGAIGSDGPLDTRLAAWRDAGGSLAVRRLSVAWGPLDLDTSADLHLDGQLQPTGTAIVRMAGWSEAIDALARTDTVPAGSAMAAKAVLSLLARAPEDGTREEVEVRLTDRQRTLSFGQIPLMKLPLIGWSVRWPR